MSNEIIGTVFEPNIEDLEYIAAKIANYLTRISTQGSITMYKGGYVKIQDLINLQVLEPLELDERKIQLIKELVSNPPILIKEDYLRPQVTIGQELQSIFDNLPDSELPFAMLEEI